MCLPRFWLMAHPEQPLDASLWDQAGQPLNRRHEPRLAVGSVLPVQLRFLPAGQPPGPWITADILDISHGGMALLLVAFLFLTDWAGTFEFAALRTAARGFRPPMLSKAALTV